MKLNCPICNETYGAACEHCHQRCPVMMDCRTNTFHYACMDPRCHMFLVLGTFNQPSDKVLVRLCPKCRMGPLPINPQKQSGQKAN